MIGVTAACIAVLLALAAAAGEKKEAATDWPSWRGPFSSGAADSGAEWVDTLDQARLLWTSEPVGLTGCGHGSPDHLATGFCDPIIADRRVYLFWFERSGTNRVEWERIAHSQSFGMRRIQTAYHDPREKEEQGRFEADDVFLCLHADTGKTLWKRVFREQGFNHRKVYSPLAVPCAAGGRLYGLGSAGRLYCLDAATGKLLWENDLGKSAAHFEQMRELCRETAARGYEPTGFNHGVNVIGGAVVVGDSGSPLDGENEESRRDVGMLGFDARTGEFLWRVPACLHRWGTPSCWRHRDKDYVLAAGIGRMVAVEPRTGRVVWEHRGDIDKWGRVLQSVSDSVTLAVGGDYVVINTSTGKSEGGTVPSCYRLDLTGARRIWELPPSGMAICHVGAVIFGSHAYVFAKGGLGCVDLESGRMLGTVSGFGHAYSGYIGADGRLVDGNLRVIKGWPDFKKMDGKLPGDVQFGYIQGPAAAGGRIYLRGRTNVYCWDVRKNPPAPDPAAPAALPCAPDLRAIRNDAAQLAAVVEKEDWPARGAAADLLRAMRKDAAPAAGVLQKALLSAVDRKDGGDVDLLVDTLLAVDPAAVRPAVPGLTRLLASDDYGSVSLGCRALGAIGPAAAEAVPALVRLLKPDDLRLTPAAAEALGRMGPAASAAVPALWKCLPAREVGTPAASRKEVRFDQYHLLDVEEEKLLAKADKAFTRREYEDAAASYDSFIAAFPRSKAAAYATARREICAGFTQARSRDAGEDFRSNALTYHAVRALFFIGSPQTSAVPAMVEWAMTHPWIGRSHGLGSDVLPRYNSYGVLLLSKLGPEAVPILLEKARERCDAGHYEDAADMVEAAFMRDPASAPQGLAVLESASRPKTGRDGPGEGSRLRLNLVTADLNGTIDIEDPRGIIKQRRKAAEEAERTKKEARKVVPTVDIVPD